MPLELSFENLTADQIKDLNGQHLNAYIAKAIFNYRNFYYEPTNYGLLICATTSDITVRGLPRYSTEIDQAMKVVDKLKKEWSVLIRIDEDGVSCDLQKKNPQYDPKWRDYLDAEDPRTHKHIVCYAEAKTIERAICEAAVKSKLIG